MLPLVEHGRALLVEGAPAIDDRMMISPAPGHTPGHVTMRLESKGDSALFTGDIMHHPMQVYEPHWNRRFCEVPEDAARTRRRVLESLCDTPTLMLPAHFPVPHCGHVKSAGNGFRFAFAD